MITMTQFTTTEVAEKFETTSRTLRKFLRADARAAGKGDTLPGKGSRYAIEGKDLASMRKRFKTWQAAEAQARKERAEKAAAEAEAQVETDDEVEEPTDEDLAAIEE